jgi:hypothetical protein
LNLCIVQVDTGSSDIFLPSVACRDEACAGHHAYDSSASSTSSRSRSSERFALRYGDGSECSGRVSSDIVRLAGLAAYNQSIGVADHYSTRLSKANYETDGLLGLAFKSLSDFNGEPFFDNLVKQRKLSEQVFALNLKPGRGELTLGGLNSAAFTGKPTYTPVIKAAWWTVKLDAMTLSGSRMFTNRRAIIDSGTTNILGPRADVRAFYAAIPGSRSASDIGFPDGFYTGAHPVVLHPRLRPLSIVSSQCHVRR